MDKTINRKWIIIFVIILVLFLVYFLIYKPYFTIDGIIERQVKEEQMLEKKVLYYACELPKEHKFHKMLMKECNNLELRAKHEDSQQNCSSDYMGGCN